MFCPHDEDDEEYGVPSRPRNVFKADNTVPTHTQLDEEKITMTVTEVTYERLTKIKNVPFENERASITISLGPNDSPDNALAVARATVNNFLGLGPSKSEIAKAKQILKDASVLAV